MEDLNMVNITHYGEYHIDNNCIYVKDKNIYKDSLIEAKKR